LVAHGKLVCVWGLLLISNYLFASPLNGKLLSLVPPGVGIVAGFENYPDPHRHGQLLLSTHNDRVDLCDWLAISGVDSQRHLDEGIEIASSPAGGGLLTEHLLLVIGKFEKNRIYKSAEQNGAQRSEYDGEALMLIQPYTRERGEMEDVRWLLILENRIGMLGTPFLVKQALRRYQAHADIDWLLKERLSRLPRDVSSWNLLVSATAKMHVGDRWAGVVDETDVVMVGARFGPTVRVDFLLDADRNRGLEFFRQKGLAFARVFAGVLHSARNKSRLAKVWLEPDRVRASVELSNRQFEMWSEQGKQLQDARAARPASRGE